MESCLDTVWPTLAVAQACDVAVFPPGCLEALQRFPGRKRKTHPQAITGRFSGGDQGHCPLVGLALHLVLVVD